MKPVNNQLFYYVLLIYAVAMVAYVVLPMGDTVVVAGANKAPATQAIPAVENVAATSTLGAAVARPVLLDAKVRVTPPLLAVPADEPLTPVPTVVKDAPKSL